VKMVVPVASSLERSAGMTAVFLILVDRVWSAARRL
jgi:hypothetical protein